MYTVILKCSFLKKGHSYIVKETCKASRIKNTASIQDTRCAPPVFPEGVGAAEGDREAIFKLCLILKIVV